MVHVTQFIQYLDIRISVNFNRGRFRPRRPSKSVFVYVDRWETDIDIDHFGNSWFKKYYLINRSVNTQARR